MPDALSVKAATFLALHKPGNPAVLPTVWDAWSADLAQDAGFGGLTVGSHPAATSIGKPDNEGLTFDELLTRVAQITAAVDLPVSVDIEAGYGATPDRLVEGLIAVGAVGFNIEDTVHSEGGRFRDAQEHADLVAALRAASDAAGVHLVINARTDVFVRKIGVEADRFDLAVRRLRLCAEAGADVLYPVGGHDAPTWAKFAESLPLPVNAIAFPDRERLSDYAPLGVGRISFGPRLQNALSVQIEQMLQAWK